MSNILLQAEFCFTVHIIFILQVQSESVVAIRSDPYMLVLQELIAKDIDGSELDFSRYGDTFFEVAPFPTVIPYHFLFLWSFYIFCY